MGNCLFNKRSAAWRLLLPALLFACISSSATTYYVDASGGDDDNGGLSELTPWQTLAKVNSLFFLPGDQESVPPENRRIGQGYLEMANVSAIEESVKMIDTFRSYQSAQRLVTAFNDILDTAVNEVGRG